MVNATVQNIMPPHTFDEPILIRTGTHTVDAAKTVKKGVVRAGGISHQ